ncbi:MAG: MarR family winged helix-turn-helix transcriptional regulator [Actinomycetota bacterium]
MMTDADAPDLPERLRLVVTRLARRLRQQAEAPISPTQSAALATIERRGPLTLGELAEIERVQPPTITAAVGRLGAQGLVERQRDPEDRRVARVHVTKSGRKLLEETRSRTSAYLERRVGELSDRDRATLERAAAILERLLEDQ